MLVLKLRNPQTQDSFNPEWRYGVHTCGLVPSHHGTLCLLFSITRATKDLLLWF